tara:strand:+ start:240 stop:1763 length:1524 start_codon:yes stop_codon:yes gene_type:complete
MLTGTEARSKLLRGVNLVADAVKGTLGPQARTVILQNPLGGYPAILNDGVTIARAVTDQDPYVQMGIDLMKQVSAEAQGNSGDGTTSATIIAKTLANGSLSLMEKQISPQVVRDALISYTEQTRDYLESKVNKEFDLVDVATIASNNDEDLGRIIASVMKQNGDKGTVTIEKSMNGQTYVDSADGFEIYSGYIHRAMSNAPRNMCEYENPLIYVCGRKINTFNDLIPALEVSIKEGRPLVVFCTAFNNSVLQNLLVNVIQGKVSAAVVQVPGMPHEQQAWLEDIAAAVGTKMETEFKRLTIDLEVLGTCKKSFIGERNTVLVDCDGDVTESVSSLTESRDSTDNEWDKEAYQNRITRLTTGISTIYVGGVTEVEQIERKERVDDAVNACKHALSDGVIAGGGSELYRAASKLKQHPKDNNAEILNLFSTALAGPITTIKENAGSDMFLNALEAEDGIYLNGVSGDIGNAWEDGVVDPVNVVINSLDAAVSVAALILMTDAAIVAPSD